MFYFIHVVQSQDLDITTMAVLVHSPFYSVSHMFLFWNDKYLLVCLILILIWTTLQQTELKTVDDTFMKYVIHYVHVCVLGGSVALAVCRVVRPRWVCGSDPSGAERAGQGGPRAAASRSSCQQH